VPKKLPFGAVFVFVLSSQHFILQQLYTVQGTGGAERKEIKLGGNLEHCMTKLKL
jgi:hypothetical protein